MHAQLPITDKMFAAFATYMLLKTNSFPCNHPVWNGKPVEDQIWAAWKECFKPLQMALERKTSAAVNAPNIFGTAAAEQRLHGIIPLVPANDHGGNTPGLLELMDGQFDALAVASSTSNAALDHLAAATTKQYAEITAALKNLSTTTSATPAATATTATSNRTAGTRTGSLLYDQRETEKRILILEANFKKSERSEASAQRMATASAPDTAAPTETIKGRATSPLQPKQAQPNQVKVSTRAGTTGSCDRMGGRIT